MAIFLDFILFNAPFVSKLIIFNAVMSADIARWNLNDPASELLSTCITYEIVFIMAFNININ